MGGTKLSDLEGLKKKEMDYLMDYTMSGIGTRQKNRVHYGVFATKRPQTPRYKEGLTRLFT